MIFLGLAPESTAPGDHHGHFEVAGYRMVYGLYMIMGSDLAQRSFPFFEKGHLDMENFDLAALKIKCLIKRKIMKFSEYF